MVDEDRTDWTLEQAARVLGKSVRTICRLLQDGTLKGYKVHGQRRDEWRVKPVKVTDLESVKDAEGPTTQDEDDRLCQLLIDKDGEIETLVIRTGHLEALLSERDKEIKQLTDRLEQSGERMKAAEEARDLSNKEREAAIKEAAVLEGQVQALMAQNTELMSKLSERPIQAPITTSPPDMTPAAEETCHGPEEPVVSPEQSRTVKVILQVTAKNAMNCPLGTVLLARGNIEKAVLSRFGMKQISNEQGAWKSTGEYELVLSQADHPGLDKQIQDICQQCQHEASKLKCIAKCEFKS